MTKSIILIISTIAAAVATTMSLSEQNADPATNQCPSNKVKLITAGTYPSGCMNSANMLTITSGVTMPQATFKNVSNINVNSLDEKVDLQNANIINDISLFGGTIDLTDSTIKSYHSISVSDYGAKFDGSTITTSTMKMDGTTREVSLSNTTITADDFYMYGKNNDYSGATINVSSKLCISDNPDLSGADISCDATNASKELFEKTGASSYNCNTYSDMSLCSLR